MSGTPERYLSAAYHNMMVQKSKEMLRLTGPTGDEFGLRIAGYQFPDILHDEYDSNWLIIETTAKVRGRAWTSRDPSLLTREVAWLADWLEALANRTESENEASFLEPNLLFQLLWRVEDRARVRVYFELESRPPWAPPDGASMEDLWAELECTAVELRALAETIRKQREEFPPRAGVGTTRDKPHSQRM